MSIQHLLAATRCQVDNLDDWWIFSIHFKLFSNPFNFCRSMSGCVKPECVLFMSQWILAVFCVLKKPAHHEHMLHICELLKPFISLQYSPYAVHILHCVYNMCLRDSSAWYESKTPILKYCKLDHQINWI